MSSLPENGSRAVLERFGVIKEYEGLQAAVAARVPIRKDLVICADGRFGETVVTTKGDELDVDGGGGSLGQDLGLVLAVAAYREQREIPYDPEQLTRQAVRAALQRVGSFNMHTSDSHPDRICDCGHCFLCTQNSGYGVDPNNAITIIQVAQQLATTTPGVHNHVLSGGHKETSVVVNKGKDWTLPHWLKEAPGLPESALGQRFVVDPAVVTTRNQNILSAMGINGQTREILEVKARQDRLTLAALAEGMPVFNVNLGGARSGVNFAGFVRSDGTVGY